MERFRITRTCNYLCVNYEAGQIITEHIAAEHLLALGFAEYAEDEPADATESDPDPAAPAATTKE